MARCGLRMMPPFPSSPLSAVRRVFPSTAGRLACQAGPSQHVNQLKPAPSISSRQRRRHRPSPSVDRLGTPETPANPFRAGVAFPGFSGSHIATACQLACPLNGSDRITPAIGDFYFWASSGSVTLPASRYNYNSDWTPLLVGLTPAGTAASFAAPALSPWLRS
jgi:hypothetical protein